MNRKVDELGRIVIPKEIRERLSIDVYDSLDVYILDNKIVLEPKKNMSLEIKIKKALELLDSPYNKECIKMCNDLKKILEEN